jgi:K+/H+ antiporter YhaU regulatory subunit KhtT
VVAAASLVAVVVISLLITRVATVALTLTGMSRESARFQARSALSGVGFTTSEAESVVNHPVRRRIVMALMLVGSAGVVTVVATLILSLANTSAAEKGERLAFVLGGLLALWLVARSAWVDARLSRLIARILARVSSLDARDYAALLHLAGDHAVTELAVGPEDWVAGRTLRRLELREEGVVVLGITRGDGRFVGAPRFDTTIEPGDALLLYGRTERIAELDRRPRGEAGDRMHDAAVAEHEQHASDELEHDTRGRGATAARR